MTRTCRFASLKNLNSNLSVFWAHFVPIPCDLGSLENSVFRFVILPRRTSCSATVTFLISLLILSVRFCQSTSPHKLLGTSWARQKCLTDESSFCCLDEAWTQSSTTTVRTSRLMSDLSGIITYSGCACLGMLPCVYQSLHRPHASLPHLLMPDVFRSVLPRTSTQQHFAVIIFCQKMKNRCAARWVSCLFHESLTTARKRESQAASAVHRRCVPSWSGTFQRTTVLATKRCRSLPVQARSLGQSVVHVSDHCLREGAVASVQLQGSCCSRS